MRPLNGDEYEKDIEAIKRLMEPQSKTRAFFMGLTTGLFLGGCLTLIFKAMEWSL